MITRIFRISLLIGSLCLLFLFAGCDLFNTAMAGQIFYDNHEMDSITGDGYEKGAGPFMVPDDFDDCQGANVKIYARNSSGDPALLALRLSSSEEEEGNNIRLTLQPGEEIDVTFLIRLNDVPGNTNLRLWQTDTAGVADLDTAVDVKVSANITYWLFNVVAVN